MAFAKWNINGVNFDEYGRIEDKLSFDDILDLPNDLPISSNESTLTLVKRMAAIMADMGIENIGSYIGIGIDGRSVAKNICDCTFLADSETPYSAFISSRAGTVAYNIFGSRRFIIKTNYVKKNTDPSVAYELHRTTTFAGIDIINSSNQSLQGQTYGWLTVESEADPLTNNPNFAGSLTNALKFSIYPSANIAISVPPINPYSLRMCEFNTIIQRSSVPFNFYVDVPVVPTITAAAFVNLTTATSLKYFSGVPRVRAGSTVDLSIVARNVISEFYNKTGTFAIINSAQLNDASYILSNLDIDEIYDDGINATHSYNILTTLKSNVSGTISATLRRFSANPALYADQVITYLNIDTFTVNEEELRVRSGSGLNPSIGAHVAFDDQISLLDTQELQFIGNRFAFPYIDFTNQIPAGPNYSLCRNDVSGYRWATFKYTSITSETISRAQIIVTNISELNAQQIKIFVKFNSESEWLDAQTEANEDFEGIVDEDFTLNVTCGDSVNVDYQLVRIGIPYLSQFSFERILFLFISE